MINTGVIDEIVLAVAPKIGMMNVAYSSLRPCCCLSGDCVMFEASPHFGGEAWFSAVDGIDVYGIKDANPMPLMLREIIAAAFAGF